MNRYLVLGLKIAVTVGLLAWLGAQVDLGDVRDRLAAVGIPGAVMATLVLAMVVPATAARWGTVQHAIAAPLGVPALVRLSVVGLFFNQVLPAPIGGDAMRIWGARAAGLTLGKATSGILLERLWGLAALLLFAAPVWPWILPEAAPRAGLALVSAAVALGGFGACLYVLRVAPAALATRLPAALRAVLDDARATAWPPGRVLTVLLFSIAGLVASMGALATLSAAMGLPLGPAEIVVGVTVAMLVAIVPASFAGWGLREGALVATLATGDVSNTDMLSLSVAFGLVQLLLALPGAVLWMASQERSGA